MRDIIERLQGDAAANLRLQPSLAERSVPASWTISSTRDVARSRGGET